MQSRSFLEQCILLKVSSLSEQDNTNLELLVEGTHNSQFNCRYSLTITTLYTPSCFLVAVPVGAPTTYLRDVHECYKDGIPLGKRKRKRSIVDDNPIAPLARKDMIVPSR